MRIISWNIQHGGGLRAAAIIEQIQNWSPDIVALSEFRATAASKSMAAALHDSGFLHQETTTDIENPTKNGLMIASKYPFKVHPVEGLLHEQSRWLHVEVDQLHPMHLIKMHVPNRDSGIKYDIHNEVVKQFEQLNSTCAIAFGDTNTGVPDYDEEAKFFNRKEGQWCNDIRNVGWSDVWRKRNPQTKEYTWYTHQGVGFRLDQLFASSKGEELVKSVHYDWGTPTTESNRGPSDHAAIVIDLH